MLQTGVCNRGRLYDGLCTEHVSLTSQYAVLLQGSTTQEIKALQTSLEEARAEAATQKEMADKATALRQQQTEVAATKAQADREAAAARIAELEGRVQELQAQIGTAVQTVESMEVSQQQHLEIQQILEEHQVVIDELRQDLREKKAALQQAQEDVLTNRKQAEDRMAALEETIQQAREEDAAQMAKLDEWKHGATQAAESAAHLEVVNEQIQQLEAALGHAQEQAEAAEAGRRDTLEVRSSCPLGMGLTRNSDHAWEPTTGMNQQHNLLCF